MIITISGKPGSGKSTIGKIVARKLGYRFYSMGDLRGDIAMKMGIDIDELNRIGMKESWTDEKVDEYAKKMGEESDEFVIDGWVAFHFIPHSFKVFLDVDDSVGAERVFRDQRKDEKEMGSAAEAGKILEKRTRETDMRYKKHYGVDFLDMSNYDEVIDTTKDPPEKIAEMIVAAALEKQKGYEKNL